MHTTAAPRLVLAVCTVVAAAATTYDGCKIGWDPYEFTLPNSTCLPAWKPTWGMRNSTVLYTCNNTGLHSVAHANQFGVVVYDWSNAKVRLGWS